MSQPTINLGSCKLPSSNVTAFRQLRHMTLSRYVTRATVNQLMCVMITWTREAPSAIHSCRHFYAYGCSQAAFHNRLASCCNLAPSPRFQMHKQPRFIPHQVCLLIIHPLLALLRPLNIKVPQEPREDVPHLRVSQVHGNASARAVRKRMEAFPPITVKLRWPLPIRKPTLRMEFISMLPVGLAAV